MDKFHSIEEKYFNHKLRDIRPWFLIRETLYQEIISKEKKSLRPNTSDKEIPLFTRILLTLKIGVNTIIYLLQRKRKTKRLFVNHPRKKNINGVYVDIYTDPIIDDIDDDYIVLEGLFQLKHLKPSYQKRLIYADIFDFWPRLISLFWKMNMSEDDLAPWEALENEIYEEYKVHIDVIRMIKQECLRCKLSVWGLKRLLKKLNPEVIVEVVGYNRLNKHINIAAKELEIATIELQHGHISKQHIAYNYPKEINNVRSFPDYLSLWGEFYRDQINIPIDTKNINIDGFKFFERYRDGKQKKLNRTGLKILFISQGTIGNKLGKLTEELSLLLNQDDIITYKLHPGEVQDAKKRYNSLYELENVIVDDNLSSDLYSKIAESSVVIGVYSTALIEAASLGQQVIVTKLYGWEGMKDLINNPEISFVSCEPDAKKMLEIIKKNTETLQENRSNNANNLMSPFNSSFIDKVLEPVND